MPWVPDEVWYAQKKGKGKGGGSQGGGGWLGPAGGSSSQDGGGGWLGPGGGSSSQDGGGGWLGPGGASSSLDAAQNLLDESLDGPQTQLLMEMLQEMQAPEDPGSVESFVAYWGLDEKCQGVLGSLDPQSQQRVMQGFQPKDLSRTNQMFMGFVKSVVGNSGLPMPQVSTGGGGGGGFGGKGMGGNFLGETHTPDSFCMKWGLDYKCLETLHGLDPGMQQRVMNDFRPTDMMRTNQMFMGFVKSVAYGGAPPPTAHQAFGGGKGQAPNVIYDMPSFLAQWGLDAKCQETLAGLDPQTQQRVMNGFQPTDLARANQMFMGFVKSVTGSFGAFGAPGAQQAFGGSQAPVSTGNPAIDGFVAQWGLDRKCQEVLITLDNMTQEKVMTGFKPKDTASASRMFMGFVKSVSGIGNQRFTPY